VFGSSAMGISWKARPWIWDTGSSSHTSRASCLTNADKQPHAFANAPGAPIRDRMSDYDLTDIPAGYDRARDHGPEVLDLWMRTVAEHVDRQATTRIVDLGCGTGRFSEGLAAQFNADVIGLDPSVKMLRLARKKQRDPRVHYTLGRAEAIPLPPESVDLIFLSMSLHHFADRSVAAHECHRVLSQKGRVAIRTGTRDRISSYPCIPFFPSSRRLHEEILQESRDIQADFAAAGLHTVASKIVTQTIAPDWTAYADKLAAGADSVLARLSPEEFEAGLTAVRRYAEAEGQRPRRRAYRLLGAFGSSSSRCGVTYGHSTTLLVKCSLRDKSPQRHLSYGKSVVDRFRT
jgi:ubiquinone/menaquinone biosynthesis C-methylase UbiE